MEEKSFTQEEVIVLLKAFHLDSVKGKYSKDLLEWCNNWISYNIKETIDFDTYIKKSYPIVGITNKGSRGFIFDESRGCCDECGEGFDNEEEWLYNTECEICGHPIPEHLIIKRINE